MRDFAVTDRINKNKASHYMEDLEKREKKLQLVQQVRSRYHENQYDLSNRERIIYGRTSVFDQSEYDENMLPDSEGDSLSSFKLRLFIALALLGVIIFMDRSQIAIGGITSEKLYGMISADYEEKIVEWVEAMSNSVQD